MTLDVRSADICEGRVPSASACGPVVLMPDGELRYNGEQQPASEAAARVETAGEITSRVTASRLLTTGVFAFAFMKKEDSRELYLTIEGILSWAVELKPTQGPEARAFAAKINGVSRAAKGDVAVSPVPVLDLADQLTKLAALRDQGVLSEEEFTVLKMKLLA